MGFSLASGLRATVALACALLFGCGPADSNASAGQGGGGGSAAGAGTLGGAGGTSTAGNQAGGGASGQSGGGNAGTSASGGSSATGTGTIQVGRLLSNQGAFEASARFSTKDAITGYDCQRETFGDCQVSTCTQNGKTASPAPYAGDITLSDGKMIDVKLTATPGESYTNSTPGAVSLSGGELLTVSASGADVPAFTTEVAVPRVITISSPALDDGGMADAPTDADLVLTFDNRAADGETGTKLLAQSLGGVGMSTLSCQLATESGTATIPAAALAKVRGAGQLLLITTRTKQVQAGEFAVSVIAYLSAMNATKTKAAIIRL